jgi:glycine/D-amino acid oxidase-like deaminating enzyme/nitrite reductase/ring-hydroxylating ferredoxin subunit
MQRDGVTKSIWQHNMPAYSSKNNMSFAATYDVLIVGGGMTGIVTALLLQLSGKKTIVAEAKSIGFGTTGGTSAHLNTMLDSPYNEIEKNFGDKAAQSVCLSVKQAISLIDQNVEHYNIDCGYSKKNGYLFSQDEKQSEELAKIIEASKRAGCDVEWTNSIPIPVEFEKAVVFGGQAQFHPAKYLYAIAKAFEDAGGILLQECRIKEFEEKNDVLEIKSSRGLIKAAALIYATHIPPGVNLLHFRCAPYRSYVMGVTLKDNKYPDALAYDMYDPYHYYRSQEIDGKRFLIVGGEDHKTAKEENTNACFTKLENHLRKYFDVDTIAFKWSSQYYQPVDGLPYIGHLPGNPENIYVATGYNGNGMIFAHVAARVLHDIIVTGKSNYQELYDPNRVKPIAGFSEFVKDAADVVGTLVSSLFPASRIKELAEIAKGEARIVKYEGKTIALFKDEEGDIHAVDPACTHISCSVGWNAAERSWDCPCHGSRFNINGEVLTAPARKDLQKIELQKE